MPISFVRTGTPKVYLPGYKSGVSPQSYDSLVNQYASLAKKQSYGTPFQPGEVAKVEAGRFELNANSLISAGVKAPAYAVEAPLRPLFALGEATGVGKSKEQWMASHPNSGIDVLGAIGDVTGISHLLDGAGELLKQTDYAGAGFVNAGLAEMLRDAMGKPDNFMVGKFSAGEVRRLAMARWSQDFEGNTYTLKQLEERAAKNTWDFGQFQTDENGLTDFLIRTVANPINLLFTPLGGAALHGAGAVIGAGARYLEGASKAASWARPIIKPTSPATPWRAGYGYMRSMGRGVADTYRASHHPLPELDRAFIDVKNAAEAVAQGDLRTHGYNASFAQAALWLARGKKVAKAVYLPGLKLQPGMKTSRVFGDVARAYVRGGFQQEATSIGAEFLIGGADNYLQENNMDGNVVGWAANNLHDILIKINNEHPLSDNEGFVFASLFLPWGAAAAEIPGAARRVIKGGSPDLVYANNAAGYLRGKFDELGQPFKSNDEMFEFIGKGDRELGEKIVMYAVERSDVLKSQQQLSHMTHQIADAELDGMAERMSFIEGMVRNVVVRRRQSGALQPRSTVDHLFELHEQSSKKPGEYKKVPGEQPMERELASSVTSTADSFIRTLQDDYHMYETLAPQLAELGLDIRRGGVLTREIMDTIIAHFDATATFDRDLARQIIDMGPNLVHEDELWREFALTLGQELPGGIKGKGRSVAEGISREDTRSALVATRETLMSEQEIMHEILQKVKNTGRLRSGTFQVREPPYPMGQKMQANRAKVAGRTLELAKNEVQITRMRDTEYTKSGVARFGAADEVSSSRGTVYKKQSNGYYRREGDGVAVGIEEGAVRLVIPVGHEADLMAQLNKTIFSKGPRQGQIKPGMEAESQRLNLLIEQARMGVDEDALLLGTENGGRVIVADYEKAGQWLADHGYAESARIEHRYPTWIDPGDKPEMPWGGHGGDEPLPDFFSEEGANEPISLDEIQAADEYAASVKKTSYFDVNENGLAVATESPGKYPDPGAMSLKEWVKQGGDASDYDMYYENYSGPTTKMPVRKGFAPMSDIDPYNGHMEGDTWIYDNPILEKEYPKPLYGDKILKGDMKELQSPPIGYDGNGFPIQADLAVKWGIETMNDAAWRSWYKKYNEGAIDDLFVDEGTPAPMMTEEEWVAQGGDVFFYDEYYLSSSYDDYWAPDGQPEPPNEPPMKYIGEPDSPLVLNTKTGKFADDNLGEDLLATQQEQAKKFAAEFDERQNYYRRVQEWNEAMTAGVRRGDITEAQARQRGWTPEVVGLGMQRLKPIPDIVYHAGTDLPNIRNLGMLTGTEVREKFGPRAGLGGPLSHTTSFTDDPARAERIAEVLLEAGQVTRGELPLSELAQRANEGGFMDRWMNSTAYHTNEETFKAALKDKYVKTDMVRTAPTKRLAVDTEVTFDIYKAEGGGIELLTGAGLVKKKVGKNNYEIEVTIGSKTGQRIVVTPDEITSPKGAELGFKKVTVPMTDAEAQQYRYTLYRDFLDAQGRAFPMSRTDALHPDVSRMNPLLVEPRSELMAKIFPENVHVYKARPRSGAMGIHDETEPYLREWKLHPDVLDIEGVDKQAAYSFRGGDPHAIMDNMKQGTFAPYRPTRRIERTEKAAIGVARGDARRASLYQDATWSVGPAVTATTSMFPEERLRTLQEHTRATRNRYKLELQAVSEMDAVMLDMLPFQKKITDMNLRDWVDPPSIPEVQRNIEFWRTMEQFPNVSVEPSVNWIVDPTADRFTMLQTNLNRRQRLFMDYGPLSPINRFYDALLAPKHARWLGKMAHTEVHNLLALAGWDPGQSRKFMAAVRQRVLESKEVTGPAKLIGAHLYPSVQSLPENVLRTIARDIAPGAAEDVLERYGTYQHMITQASNRLLRSASRATRSGRRMNKIERAADAAFRMWQYHPALRPFSGFGQRFTKFTYPFLRFHADPAFMAMNWIEPYTYNILNNGWRGRFKAGAGVERRSDLASAGLIPPGGLFAKEAPEELLLADPGFYTIPHNIRPNMIREFGIKTDKDAELMFEALGPEHPIARLMRDRFGDNVKDWAKEMNRMMESLVQKGPEHLTRKAWKETLEGEMGMSLAELKQLAPVAERLTERYRGVYADLADLYIGRMNRSNLERMANNYFLFWPISYMVKVTGWAYNLMMKKIGPVEGNFGAYAWDQWRQKYEDRYTNDGDFRNWVDENPDFMFAMEMIAPVTPASIGVSLSRITRYAGNWVADESNLAPGIFGDYTPETIPEAISGSARVGPVRTWNMVNNILKAWEVPGFYTHPSSNEAPSYLR